MLSKAGYRIRVFLDEDPQKSSVYAKYDGKVCKSKSFPFMSKHTNPFYLKTEQMNLRQLGRMLGYEAIMNCGTKGWAFPQTEISEILLFTLQAWKNLDH
jgi:hypothetical protein